MPFIIDGHNLLHSVKKTDENFESINEIQLCRALGRYFNGISESGEIVFDGTGPPDKSGFDNIIGIGIAFAGPGIDTDSVMETMIKASSAPRRLTIVSSDRRIRRAAQRRKATALKSDIFWNQVSKQLSRKKIKKEPAEKRMGISEGETQQWLKLFGLDK